MEISKISVGVEALPVTDKVTLVAQNKLYKFRSLVVRFFVSTGKFVKRIFTGIAHLVTRMINSLRTARFKKEESINAENENSVGSFHKKNRQPVNFNKIKKAVFLLVALFLLISVTVIIKNNLFKLTKNDSSGTTLGDRVEVKDALKTLVLNREFGFPLSDAKGKEISRIKYVVEKAELRDEIIVKGQKATAVKGRLFLVVYLKITNEYTQKIEMSTKDYVRLSVNGNESEWLAPDIHNDPVEIQAQSTKVTRLGFPINESDTKMLLRIGQISGNKEKVELNF